MKVLYLYLNINETLRQSSRLHVLERKGTFFGNGYTVTKPTESIKVPFAHIQIKCLCVKKRMGLW